MDLVRAPSSATSADRDLDDQPPRLDQPYGRRSLGATADADARAGDPAMAFAPTGGEAALSAVGAPVQRRASGRTASAAEADDARPPIDAITSSVLAVQRRGGAGDPAVMDDPARVHAAAARGTSGAATGLPHLATIQQAFGRHDVGGVQAHLGGEAEEGARAMGADAFASGDHVAFAGSPDLHTAAHEAAHVVQQRAGVHLAGGVGDAGDPYERHADEVADAVVAGGSAEGLLDRHAGAGGGGGGGAGVQRRIRLDDGVGEDFDPEVDYVRPSWGFTAAERGIYLRWLRDGDAHRYGTAADLKAAIKRVASQPFGTDIAAAYPDVAEQKQIFLQALRAGYRVFDSAVTYETLTSLQQAIAELGIARDEITVIYKLKPADDTALDAQIGGLRAQPPTVLTAASIRQATRNKLTTRLEAARGANGQLPDVLMLHDLDADDAVIDANIGQLAAEVVAGNARALGVSNAAVYQLDRIRPIAAAAGAPIKYVQNRCSPYHRDEDVVAYCATHGITYMAYGMMGSAQVGACAGVGDEGEGLPTQYQLARHDPRLKALATQRNISEGELLIGWAQQRGIVPVSFSSRGDQAERNLARAATPLPADLVQALDEMFVNPSAAQVAVQTARAPGPLKALYAAYQDPTAWSILDTLGGAPGGDALLTSTATAIVGVHAGAPEQAAALKNFALNLVRHVGDIQSAIQRMQNEKAQAEKRNKALAPGAQPERVPAAPYADWHAVLIPAFTQLAAAAGAPQVAQAFTTWAQRNCLAGHTMGHALEAWDDISRTPAPQPVVAAPPPPPVVVAAQPVAQAHPEQTVGYDDPALANEYALVFADGEREGLAADGEVYYQNVLHEVVRNEKASRRLVIRRK